jgi:flavin-dependent thymidylate synthase
MLKVQLIDKNENGLNTIIKGLSLCKDKSCSDNTITSCIIDEHYSALEKVWFSFYVEGLSIKARIQLLRHRLFSTMERSSRFINVSNDTCIIPETAKDPDLFKIMYRQTLSNYKLLIETGESLENAAYMLPTGTETRFTLDGNGRIFFEYLKKRDCIKHVQIEHYRFAQEIYKQLNQLYPIIYNDNFLGCKACGLCIEVAK